MRSHLLLLVSTGLAGCGGNTSLPIDASCNPLAAAAGGASGGSDGACLVPWPSSVFEVDDPSTATGRRLAIPEDSIPRGITDLAVDPARWNAMDGFSPSAPIVIAFPGGVAPDDLPSADNMDLSLAVDSPTVILDMTTNTRVAHYAELDPAGDLADSQAVFLRPAARLTPGHRYAVAITQRLLARDGSELPVSPGFAALRDGRKTDHQLLEAMRPRFEEVLEALAEAEIPDDELVIAWDFTVASDATTRADLIAARERALITLAATPSLYTITSDRQDAGIRTITGAIDAPLLLSNGGDARAGTRVVRDQLGMPVIQGLYRIPFTATVPSCAERMPIAIYGHSAFGDSSEVAGDAVRTLAAELCMVVIGTDLRGMSRADLPALARVGDDLNRTDEIFDVLLQGMVDQTTLIVALRDKLADQLGRVDRSRIYYLGDASAIAGPSLIALEPAIQRGVLLGAGDLAMAFDRAALTSRLQNTYPDPIAVIAAQSLLELRWDRIESFAFGSHKPVVIRVDAPEAPSSQTAYWLARSLEVALVTPSPITPWGMRTTPSPASTGLVIGGTSAQIREFLGTGQLRTQ